MMAGSSLRRRSVEPTTYDDNIEMKGSLKVAEAPDDRHDLTDAPVEGTVQDWRNTEQDVRDMMRLGKKQECAYLCLDTTAD